MRKWPIILLVAVVFFAACDKPAKGRNGVEYKSARMYNNYIIDRQKEIGTYILLFYGHIDTNIDSAENAIKNSLPDVTAKLEEIKGMPAYKGDSSFRDAAIHSFTFYKRLFDKEMKEMVRIYRNNEIMTEEDQQTIQTIYNGIVREEEQLDKDLHNKQKAFADKNHMGLVDEKGAKK